jgi:hypothetical protein
VPTPDRRLAHGTTPPVPQSAGPPQPSLLPGQAAAPAGSGRRTSQGPFPPLAANPDQLPAVGGLLSQSARQNASRWLETGASWPDIPAARITARVPIPSAPHSTHPPSNQHAGVRRNANAHLPAGAQRNPYADSFLL